MYKLGSWCTVHVLALMVMQCRKQKKRTSHPSFDLAEHKQTGQKVHKYMFPLARLVTGH